ncbi:MAG: hypothetical protein V3S14_14490 [Anaerolineae bacterium]
MPAACCAMSAGERAIRKAAFHAILDGEAIDRAGLVAATSFAPEKVDALLDGLTEQGLVVIEPDSGQVLGSWGLSSLPTNHRLHIRRRALTPGVRTPGVRTPGVRERRNGRRPGDPRRAARRAVVGDGWRGGALGAWLYLTADQFLLLGRARGRMATGPSWSDTPPLAACARVEPNSIGQP